ncbi:MAG: tryptophan synthase subunit alpha [Nitrospinae bacterium]|nr:tryptophan synthase subunit alpha [Nitrospinota bacterium]
MGRIEKRFKLLQKEGEKALIPFITAGDPDFEVTKSLLIEIERSGGDLIEIGVPFSDPLADGPIIQKSYQRALNKGVSLRKIIALIEGLREKIHIPIILMIAYNLLYQYGETEFVKDAVSAGIDGIIVPDLPPEEARSLMDLAQGVGLDIIFLLAPTSTQDRIKDICQKSQGFIYYISLTGVTGVRDKLSDDIRDKIAEIKRISEKPVVIGFGVSNPEQTAMTGELADGVVVGSAIVKIIEENIDRGDLTTIVGSFVKELKKGMQRRQ